MILQYKNNSVIMPGFNQYSLLEKSSLDNIFLMDSIFDHYSDMFDIIKDSLDPSMVIFSNNSFSFEFCEKLFQVFNSSNLTVDQQCTLIESLDRIITNDIIENNEFIFNLVLSILSINEKSSKVTDYIYKCMIDLISPKIINIFPKQFYDIIRSTEDKYFISQIAQKISKSLKPRNKIAKKSFILFLKEISKFVDNDTSLFIYTAHLNLFYLSPDTFPLLNLDFYINATKFDIETQIVFLKFLSHIKDCYEIFINPQVQNLVLFGLMKSNSSPMIIHSLRALSNLLEADIKIFTKMYNDDVYFQKIISRLNFLILESSFNIKSDAGYLLSLLLSNFPQILFYNICRNSAEIDIRISILHIFELDQIALILKLLYGLESVYLFSLQLNAFNEFKLKISEYEILDKICNLIAHENQEIACVAGIVFEEINNNIDNNE